MKLPEDCVEALLRRWPVARLATLDEGRVHLVPIVFAWWEGALWSPIDGKPKRGGELQRVRNVRREPRVTVLLDRYDADWSRLWWLRLEGRAEVVTTEAPEHDPRFAEPAARLRAKYPQYRSTPLFRGDPTLLRVHVERRVTWCASEAVIAELRER